MDLLKKIESDYITAYKAKDSVRLTVLRLLKTAVKNLQVERSRAELSEGDILDVVAKQCKQRQDSIEQFRSAGRDDLANKEAAELAVLESYLPERITGDALGALVREIIASVGASGPRDMGKVMQALTAGHKGSYDGREASELVRIRLQELAAAQSAEA